MKESDIEAAGRHWDEQLKKLQTQRVGRNRWWEDETTKKHINGVLGHPDLTEVHAAFHERISAYFEGRNALKALSVGCGAGTKELCLAQRIDFAHFDLFDISADNICLGRRLAAEHNVADIFRLQLADAFKQHLGSDYDLVYWNNSLHHMSDVAAAIKWSRERLKAGGLFAMDDFVGPDRFQWTDVNLRWASAVRAALPVRYLDNAWAPGNPVAIECHRPTVEEVVSADPSEAVESSKITDELKATFPGVEIIPTGGALYHLALNDIFWNFRSEGDLAILRQILVMDHLLAAQGTTQYAVAFASV